jgi:hypothetical protein
MDLEEETRLFKILLFFGLMFLVSTFFAYKELKYWLRGRTIKADLIEVRETTSSGRRRQPMLVVEYGFTEPGATTRRRETDRVSVDWEPPTDKTVMVQYFPGTDDSRLAGHANVVAVVIFFASFAVTAFFVGRLWMEARQAVAEKHRAHPVRRR